MFHFYLSLHLIGKGIEIDLDFSLSVQMQKPSMKTTVGVIEVPFGNTRLQIAKLVAALIMLNQPSVHEEFAKLGTVDLLLVKFCFIIPVKGCDTNDKKGSFPPFSFRTCFSSIFGTTSYTVRLRK